MSRVFDKRDLYNACIVSQLFYDKYSLIYANLCSRLYKAAQVIYLLLWTGSIDASHSYRKLNKFFHF